MLIQWIFIILAFVFGSLIDVNTGWAQVSKTVWIDADPACDEGKTNDVDDCWALAYALSHPGLHVRGISTSYGNTAGDKTFHISKHLLQRFKAHGLVYPENRLYSGATKSIAKIQKTNDAVEALHAVLQQERLSIVALGPLSNVALLLMHYPDDKHAIKEIIAVAGQRNDKQRVFRPKENSLLHMHDLNFRKDEKAFQVVLNANIPLTLVPFELAAQFKITQSDLVKITDGSNLLRWLVNQSQQWLKFWRTGFGIDGFFPFDLLAVVYVTNPEWLTCESTTLNIIHRRTLFRESRSNLIASKSDPTSSKHMYCYAHQKYAKTQILTQIQLIGKQVLSENLE